MLRLCLAVIVAGTGCASELSMVKSENHRLREQVTQLRADKRRGDRKVRELENEIAALGGGDRAALGAGAPALPVTVLGPPSAPQPQAQTAGLEPGQRIVGIDDDGTAIIYEGDAASGKAASFDDDSDSLDTGSGDGDGDSDRDRDRAPPPPRHHARAPKAAATTAAATAANPEAADQYKNAVDLLRAGHHDDAVALLRDFLARWPDHDYADNAQYWLGEAYYDRKDYTKALAEFRIAVDKYPRGNKVPDALLKVGYCYLALGQGEKGRFALEQVVAIYPKTEPATLAGKRLESIGQ